MVSTVSTWYVYIRIENDAIDEEDQEKVEEKDDEERSVDLGLYLPLFTGQAGKDPKREEHDVEFDKVVDKREHANEGAEVDGEPEHGLNIEQVKKDFFQVELRSPRVPFASDRAEPEEEILQEYQGLKQQIDHDQSVELLAYISLVALNKTKASKSLDVKSTVQVGIWAYQNVGLVLNEVDIF